MTQIDHVVISIYGIFVIETKNYKGWIYGNERTANWLQNIYGHKYSIVNSVRQNYGHIKALEYVVKADGWKNVPFYSIVAYSDEAVLKVTAEHATVVNFSDLLSTIKMLSDEACMSKEQMREICKLFKKADVNSFLNRRKHIKEVKKLIKEKEKRRRQKNKLGCLGKAIAVFILLAIFIYIVNYMPDI